MIRSAIDLPWEIEFDSSLRYVDNLSAQKVPAYWELDLRLGWNPSPNLEFSVIGQNLLHGDHFEFEPADFVVLQSVDVERGVIGRVTYRF
jgi:iron complex outermembrane receptor protein